MCNLEGQGADRLGGDERTPVRRSGPGCSPRRWSNVTRVSAIGNTDLRACRGELGDDLGPIGQSLKSRKYSHIVLLSDHPSKEGKAFLKWASQITDGALQLHPCSLPSPTDYESIYREAVKSLDVEAL